MFREVITVKWRGDTYTASKINLSKEISNVSNSYHIRIQAYQLDQKIDEKSVFILQLKHTRNVRNVVSTTTPTIGISMHNQYRMDMGSGDMSGHPDNRRRSVAIRSSERKRSSSSFFDQIWLQHKSQPFLKATVNTIFRAFDCDDFIQYNEHTNQFEFKFEAKQNMTTLTKYVSLSRKQYTKEEAETLLKDRHNGFESIKPCKVQVGCVNSHEIEDKDWDFEVNLTLLPGKYEFYIDELFGKVPTQIHARDYPRIRQFYKEKLKQFVRGAGVFERYLSHLSTFEPRWKMMEWSKNGVESGPLFGLYSILCEIEADDNIWHDLFEICLKDKIDDKIIRNSISEQTVADFIALSLKYYVKDVVKRRIKYRELKKQENKQHAAPKKKTTKNKEGLDKYILSESDRYILSIILPYFGSPGLKTIHKSVGNESLTSGLFNHFCEPLKYSKKTEAAEEFIDDDTWCMKVPPLQLKNKLLKHLHVEKYDVVKQYYVAVLQHVPAVEKGDKTRWTFYIRPSTYSEIFNGKHKINMNAYTFMDYFEFKQRNVPGLQCLNLIIKCIDVSFECDWAMWTKKKLKLYPASLGYWKLLSTFDNEPRVPVDHLDCMLALLRHDAMQISNKLLRNEDQYLSVVFLKEKINAIGSGADGPLLDNKWMAEEVEAEYQLTFWNGKATGNSSLSLKLVKAAHANVDKKRNLKSRDSHFIHYRSKDEDIEWLWYDNDAAKYKEYDLEKVGNNTVPKQLEATYQGVSEEIFPLDQFKRETKSDAKERTFNCAQLPNMSQALVKKFASFKWKPFVLRFTFHKHGGKIINIEQLAINSYYDQFPRNVKRVYSGKSGVMINDEEQRVSSLGEMNIYQSKKTIVICWKFPQNAELGITLTYHYKVQIPMLHEIKFKRLLDCWRTNTLFDQTMSNRSMKIVQSRMWKTDTKMPTIKDITRYDAVANEAEYGGMDKRDESDEEYSGSDEDDDKDEEKHSKPAAKKEECIPCQMISSNNERRKKHQSDTDEDSDSGGIPQPDKVRRDRSQSTTQLAQIDKYQHLKTKISDAEWDLMDKLDDKQRETSNLIKQKPVYAAVAEAQSVWSLWVRRHAPHKFRKELYKLVSLTFIQSIISVMKNHLYERYQRRKENKPLIIVISDEREMYQEIFALNHSEDYISANSKSLSYLFDAIGDVKRIDSKGNIYSIHINKLQKEIIDKGYYHEFISMTSAKFKETLVLFTRPNDERNSLYISHNGYISKISLKLHDEDLHYFLPLFIPLKVGDCVNIEAFSSPDNGTIVALWRNPERNNIVYRIRSTENVYYIMNYYKLVNRAQPKEYWYKNGIKTNITKHSAVWDDVKLWKTEKPNGDPSDPSHPLHGVILALVESSKQAIASIESQLKVMARKDKANQLELKKLTIQHKLQNTGAIFLFYRTVEMVDKGEDIVLFEQQEAERKENEREEEEEGPYRAYNDSEASDDDTESLQASNERGLSHLIKFLKRNKLICNVQKYKRPQTTSYDDFCEKAKDILRQNSNNKVYLCHMTERKKYTLEEVDGGLPEEAIDIDSLGHGGDEYEDGSGGEEDEWLTFEPEEDDKPQLKKEEAEKRVVLKSTFECQMVYEFEMCSVHSPVLTVEDIMIMQNEKRNWTTEDHKLLTQFHNNNIWNKFDLLDKQLINRLKTRLFQNHTNVGDTNKLKLLEKKFIKFTEAVPKTLKENNINSPLTQFVIAGVEVTRNAKLLQEYIEKFRRYKKSDDEQMLDYDGDAEIIESNSDRTMIVAYNPIQTVVVTSTMIKDVTHPIHLYRAAYDEKFYPKDQITQLNAEWMQTQTKNANIINALSTLLRYNKKYEIILVPSSIHLDAENFLKSRCEMVAPEHESIADYRITFLYKGLLYRYDKKKAKKFKQQSLSIIKQQTVHHLDDLDDDDEKIFVDEIKFLLRLLHDNISEEQPDAMDPDEAVFDKSPRTREESLSTTLPMIISSLTSQPSFNNYPSFSATAMDVAPRRPSTRRRLRGSIKRKHTDRIFRWLNVGCGSCFLHESSGRAKEIGPKKGADYDKEFPKQLQRAMFLYYIDCRVPFNEDIISQESQCAICKQLMIDPADIGNPQCIHIFCKLCIQQWYFVNYASNANNDNPMGGNHGAQRSSCPICRRAIREITVQPKVIPNMKRGIPTTIYQQIMEENQSRFLRQYLVDTYMAERERVLQAENSDQNLGAAMENDPRLGHRLAGYRG